MYAECSGFFDVWQKRTVGDLFPGWFDDQLTNKDSEAVAAAARFEGAKKNAAARSILLVCRKRGPEKETVWWHDIRARGRTEARNKAKGFHSQGISGVDLYISTFGPVLSILSQNWPVLSAQTDESGKPLPIQTDVALDLARKEVIALRKEGLLLGRAVKFDPVTDWYLMAWDAFRAEEFPGSGARTASCCGSRPASWMTSGCASSMVCPCLPRKRCL